MLSLNKLKIIDNELPVVVHDIVEVEVSDEDGYETETIPERNEAGVAMLVKMFKSATVKIKGKLLEKYQSCWIADMEPIIKDNGLTKGEMINCLQIAGAVHMATGVNPAKGQSPT